MASPGELILAVSQATGVPLPTVTDMDRRLTTAGLRAKGGRGLSAARMKPLDAARLLTAILASPQSNEAAEAVERYMRTRVDQDRSSDGLFAATNLEDLATLPARHIFIDALAALIASCCHGQLAKLMAESDGWTPDIKVYAFARATRARIRIAGLHDQVTANVEYVPVGRHRAGSAGGDLEQSRRITEQTILSVAELLSQESKHDRA